MNMILKTWSKIGFKDQLMEMPLVKAEQESYTKLQSINRLMRFKRNLTKGAGEQAEVYEIKKDPNYVSQPHSFYRLFQSIKQKGPDLKLKHPIFQNSEISSPMTNLEVDALQKAATVPSAKRPFDHFFIKTIKLFTNDELLSEVMTECILPTDFGMQTHTDAFVQLEHFSCNTSTVKWKNLVFYFKRIRHLNPEQNVTSLSNPPENGSNRLVLYKMTIERDKGKFEEQPVKARNGTQIMFNEEDLVLVSKNVYKGM